MKMVIKFIMCLSIIMIIGCIVVADIVYDYRASLIVFAAVMSIISIFNGFEAINEHSDEIVIIDELLSDSDEEENQNNDNSVENDDCVNNDTSDKSE